MQHLNNNKNCIPIASFPKLFEGELQEIAYRYKNFPPGMCASRKKLHHFETHILFGTITNILKELPWRKMMTTLAMQTLKANQNVWSAQIAPETRVVSVRSACGQKACGTVTNQYIVCQCEPRFTGDPFVRCKGIIHGFSKYLTFVLSLCLTNTLWIYLLISDPRSNVS